MKVTDKEVWESLEAIAAGRNSFADRLTRRDMMRRAQKLLDMRAFDEAAEREIAAYKAGPTTKESLMRLGVLDAGPE